MRNEITVTYENVNDYKGDYKIYKLQNMYTNCKNAVGVETFHVKPEETSASMQPNQCRVLL